MARSKSTEEMIGDMMTALLEEAKANEKLPEMLAGILKKMHEADPEAARSVLETIIEQTAASMPEHKRQKFLQELLALARPS